MFSARADTLLAVRNKLKLLLTLLLLPPPLLLLLLLTLLLLVVLPLLCHLSLPRPPMRPTQPRARAALIVKRRGLPPRALLSSALASQLPLRTLTSTLEARRQRPRLLVGV